MFYLAFQCVDQLAVLSEDCQVEVVVVVCNEDLSCGVYADANGVVGDTLTTNLTQEDSLVVEDFHTMSSVVTDEYFFLVVDHHTIWKLEVLGTTKFIQHITHLIKYDDTHHLALNNDDSALVVHRHSSRMLKDIRAKFTDKLAILVVDLNLKIRRC